jgi:uncharacterized membrane protein
VHARLKADAVIVCFVLFCAVIALYFAFVSFQTTDYSLRKELVWLAVYSLVAGLALFGGIVAYLWVKRMFSGVEEQVRTNETTANTTQDS